MTITSITADYLPTGNAPIPIEENFLTFDTVANWELVQTGAGMTVAPDGLANGARFLNIASGVNTSAETILLSRRSFKLPAKLTVGLSMSQRIINQDVFVELVGIDKDDKIELDTTFPSTLLNNAKNVAGFQFQAAALSQAIAIVRGAGVSELVSGNTAFSTTAASGVGPNFLPQSTYEIAADSEEVVFSARSVDSFNAPTVPIKRTQCLPDPQRRYKIRIRMRNGAVAPASTTDLRIHFIRVMETTRLTVDLARHAGRTGDASNAIPVIVNNVGGLPIAALPAGANQIGAVTMNAQSATGGIANVARLPSAAATTNATLVKGAIGRLHKMTGYNASVTVKFLKIYNKATAPVPGTDTPVLNLALKPTDQFTFDYGDLGLQFPAGIGYAITAAAADADATAIVAADIVGLNLIYA